MSATERCMDAPSRLAKAAPLRLALPRLAEGLGTPKGATRRPLLALAERGFARQDPSSQPCVAMPQLAILGFQAREAEGGADPCQPALFACDAGAFVRLAAAKGERTAYAARARGARARPRHEPTAGRRAVRPHATVT